MADYDPANQGDAWDEDEGYGVADGFHRPANTQHSSLEDQAHLSHDQALHASGDVSSDDAASDLGDYDPETVTSSLAPTPHVVEPSSAARPSPKPTAKKPKTAGGFIVDSDSEDDDSSTPGFSGLAAPPASNQTDARTASPLQNVTTLLGTRAPASSKQEQVIQRSSPAAPSSGHDQSFAGSLPAVHTQQKVAQDKIAVLEDRVREDPRGAMDAWLALMREYRDRSKINDARKTYDRFLAVFPQAADIWADYIDMELGMNNFVETEKLFGMCLLNTPNVNLWTKYLDYIRRRNDLNDSTGHARQVVAQSYEFVIDNIGCDKDSGKIWAEYIQFIKFGPGQVGGSSWQDQQKMDQLRKAYQRAICVPIQNVNTLWKEYDQFEMGLNKTTGRKFLAERSPAYMSAKSANTALENVTRGLQRTNLPRLPPAPGFDGDVEYLEQVEIWKRWIAFEKSDPLDIKTDEPELFRKRILYAYKQALMALRFWPEMWVDAAEWCFENDITKDGTDIGLDLLRQGITANPESVLLALKHADRIEATYPIEENDEAKIARGQAVREPYNKVLDTLYDLIKALKDREETETKRIKEAAAQAASAASSGQPNADYDDEDEDAQTSNEKARKEQTEKQLEAVKQGFAAQTQLLSRTVSFVWIALARAMRRIQGKGKPGTALGGMRQVFIDARPRGRLTSDVYVAMAQLEWTVYKEPAGAKIFERGSKLFPEDEYFTVEYLKFLHSRDDFTNARVVFETVVNRLTQKPESVHKAKPLYAYFHKFESQFGELAQISKLEKRMAELYPEDPKLSHFTARFSTEKFDPIAARIIISPATQLKPKFGILSSIEQRQSVSVQDSPRPQARAQPSPRPQYLQARDSPKRPFPTEDYEDLPPRKALRGDHQDFVRGASPLKGAAGRRLDQQRRGGASQTTTAPLIPRDVTFLLGLIPPAHTYNAQRFHPSGVVRLLQETHVPDFVTWRHREPNQAQRHNPQSSSHNRQPSSDHPPHQGFQSRDSPNPQGRPSSPYTGEGASRGRLAPGSATYRQSSLRPGSSGSYEPPPAAYSQLGHAQAQQPQYPPGPPQQQAQYDGGAAAGWPTYGAAPPVGAPQAYGTPAPTGYHQMPQQPPAPYQHYQY